MSTTRVCTKCNEEKEIGEFYNDKTKSTGLKSQCKMCCGKKKRPVHTASTKVCTICNEEKEFGEFYKDKSRKYGLRSECKMCFPKNKEEHNQKTREYYQENKEEIIQQKKEYYEENKEEINKRAYENKKKRLAEDPLFKLITCMRSRILIAIKSQAGEKAAKSIELLGCCIEHVRDHLESQFTEGMTWENHGEWHIDHMRPCASFNLEEPEDQKKCFHWTNLQPLWAADNLAKGARLDWVKT